MKKIAFLDRDGTLIVEPPETFQVNSLEEMEFLPGVISALKKLSEAGYRLVMVTNQDGLGTEVNPRENYEKINRKMFQIFSSENIFFDEIFECPHSPEDQCFCRKPKTGILGDFLEKNNIDFQRSCVVGDRQTDIDFANNISVQGFLLGEQSWDSIILEILKK